MKHFWEKVILRACIRLVIVLVLLVVWNVWPATGHGGETVPSQRFSIRWK